MCAPTLVPLLSSWVMDGWSPVVKQTWVARPLEVKVGIVPMNFKYFFKKVLGGVKMGI